MHNLKGSIAVAAAMMVAASGFSQTFRGSVDILANATGGGAIHRGKLTLPGQLYVTDKGSVAGPGVSAEAFAAVKPGRISVGRGSEASPGTYSQAWAQGRSTDYVRISGSSPMAVRFRVSLSGGLDWSGSNPMQTDTSVNAYVNFFAEGKTIQRYHSNSVSSNGYSTYRSDLSDATVTLNPGKWYAIDASIIVNGDASDSTEPYTDTNSSGAYTLTYSVNPVYTATAFRATDGLTEPRIEFASGFRGAPVPEPASIATLAVGGFAFMRRRKSSKR